tara:strand:- start:390 stop:923 length:534 start_codon:yes stop_codon:yes gene_type:complete
MDNVVVIDNVISKGYQDLVERILTGTEFPWFFNKQITNARRGSPDSATGFSHMALEQGKVKNQYADILTPILYEAVDKHKKDQDIREIYRIRLGMFVKKQTHIPHIPHTDNESFHYVMLYYVNDSDGPTNIFSDNEIVEKIEPKKGRALIFAGDIYHSSSSPRDHDTRVVVNYNFLL